MLFGKFTSDYYAAHDNISGAACNLAGIFPRIFYVDRNAQRFELTLCNADKRLRQQSDGFVSGSQLRNHFTVFGIEIDCHFVCQIVGGKNVVEDIFRSRSLTGNSNGFTFQILDGRNFLTGLYDVQIAQRIDCQNLNFAFRLGIKRCSQVRGNSGDIYLVIGDFSDYIAWGGSERKSIVIGGFTFVVILHQFDHAHAGGAGNGNNADIRFLLGLYNAGSGVRDNFGGLWLFGTAEKAQSGQHKHQHKCNLLHEFHG